MLARLFASRNTPEGTLAELSLSSVLTKRDSPKIGGSFPAFITVVIILVLIIVISSIGVVYLLRESAAEDEELMNRGQRSRHANHDAYTFHSKFENANTKAFGRRIRRFFGLRGRDPDIPSIIIGQGSHGWVQANGSDWDSDEDLSRLRQSGRPSRNTEQASSSLAIPTHILSSSSRPAISASDPALADPSAIQGEFTLPTVHTRLSSPSFSPSPSPSPISTLTKPPEAVSSTDLYPNGQGRLFATQSGVSMRTFEGGTKFIEAL